jgi:chromosome segregation ATPase
MANEPENLVLELLRGIRAEMATRGELADVTAEVHSLRADVAADLVSMQAKTEADQKATRDQIVGLRRALVEYHSAVIGHGVLISELEARVRRVEQHLNLPAIDAH